MDELIFCWLKAATAASVRALESSLALNVYGGILASLVFLFCGWARNGIKGWRFKQVFGKGNEPGICLVYEEMELDDKSNPFPYSRPSSAQPIRFSISRPIPIASVRAVSYLSTAIGKFIGKTPNVRSDLEMRNTMDLDFVCFGGPRSNVMTDSCQENSGNRLATLDQSLNQFLKVTDGTPLVQIDPVFDYGLILKLHPVQFPTRVWIACEGLGERGTSGAAWFLANKWEEIRKRAGDRPFAALVKVEADVLSGRDQSSELVALLI
jgi:hypothetical protein